MGQAHGHTFPRGAIKSSDGQVVVWEFQHSAGRWTTYDPEVAAEIEKAHAENTDAKFRIKGIAYEIRWTLWCQINTVTGTARPVRRRVIADEASVAAAAGSTAAGAAAIDAALAASGSSDASDAPAGAPGAEKSGSAFGGRGGAGGASGAAGGSARSLSSSGSGPARLRTRRCRFHERRAGSCRHGPSCWFYHAGLHPPDSTRPPLRCDADMAGRVCPDRASGTCEKVHALEETPAPTDSGMGTPGSTHTPVPPPPAVPAALTRAKSEAGSECIVCWDAPREVTLVHGQTGHFVCCQTCADDLPEPRECPICREPVEKAVRTFFS